MRSTTHALVYLLFLIYASFDQDHCSIRIFFTDLKKGFDLVDHNFIIDELGKLQVDPAIRKWILPLVNSLQKLDHLPPHELLKNVLCDKDLVSIYSSFIRTQIKYALPARSALIKNESDLIESIGKRALRIILPELSFIILSYQFIKIVSQ